MMAIGFAVGYGCPLVIAATTVASTVPGKGYVRRGACWLNWDDTKALLAFAIPALVIVAVNLVVVLVVAINTQRPSIGSSKSQDVAIILRISKNVAILTPLLGLTWGFGIATLIEGTSLIFHIIFALLNAFQVSSGRETYFTDTIDTISYFLFTKYYYLIIWYSGYTRKYGYGLKIQNTTYSFHFCSYLRDIYL